MQFAMPEEFLKACRNLGQDLVGVVQELSEDDAEILLVQTAIIGLDRIDAQVVRNFVAQLLGANLNSDELKDFWWATPAEIHFQDGLRVERFLRSLERRLAASPYVTAE